MNEMPGHVAFFFGVFVALFFSLTIGLTITIEVIRSKAKKAGAGEYYLDGNDIKCWRWTGSRGKK